MALAQNPLLEQIALAFVVPVRGMSVLPVLFVNLMAVSVRSVVPCSPLVDPLDSRLCGFQLSQLLEKHLVIVGLVLRSGEVPAHCTVSVALEKVPS